MFENNSKASLLMYARSRYSMEFALKQIADHRDFDRFECGTRFTYYYCRRIPQFQ
jgi:hypothetical protein